MIQVDPALNTRILYPYRQQLKGKFMKQFAKKNAINEKYLKSQAKVKQYLN